MSSSPGRRPYLHAPAPSSVAVFEPDVDPVSSAEISSARPLDDAPRITTLGRFGVTLPNVTGDQPPVLLRGQAQHLLKCLLAAPSYQRSSDQLADLLWPQLSPEASQAALRQTLSRLRRTLEPQAAPYGRARYITREDGVVSLRLASDDTDASALWVDRYHFERLATTAIAGLTPQAVPERALQAQQMGDAALALYRGEFLAFDLYADWTRTVRDRCRRLWTQLLGRLSEVAMAERDFGRAMLLLAYLLDAVPDDEVKSARLMLVQAVTGHRGDALRTYKRMCAYLSTTFGATPSDQLQQYAQAIRGGASLHELLDLLDKAPSLLMF